MHKSIKIFFLMLVSVAAFGDPATYLGFDATAVDTKIDPCENFFQYVCHTWVSENPIPGDQAAWGQFQALRDRNNRILKDLLETSEAKKNRTPNEQKIADYYGSCMDEKGIEAKGLAPVEPALKEIAALPTKSSLAPELAKLHREGINAFFAFGSEPDHKDSDKIIAVVDQGGLGLPERDYYIRTDPKSVEQRNAYVAHIQKIFELAGRPADQAAAMSKTVLGIETDLAKASLDRVERRDPAKTYHKMTVKDVEGLAPAIDWEKYFADTGAPKFTGLNVGMPEFFKGLSAVFEKNSLDDLKTYLAWHYLHAVGNQLTDAFVQANFDFYQKTLQGQKEMKPRWKRCVTETDGDLGEALGQKYVETAFAGESKAKTLEMVHNIFRAMEQDLNQLTWMTDTTKKRALEKLNAIQSKIGYPDKWRDYSKLKIVRGDALGNALRANEFATEYQFAKIGKTVNRAEWYMTPPTVNAYYNPLENNINFPAGILQPPFYDVKLDEAVNYGAIGAVIGHELTHGFDDQGRQFDAKGNFNDWWTAGDATEFKKRADCVDQEYSKFVAVGDVNVNGKLTLGENTADNGGVRIAYMALLDALAKRKTPPAKVDNFTPEQRFFLGYGEIWCGSMTDSSARTRALTDPHSPSMYRVNGTLSNMPEFQKAFGCKAGQPMVRENACRVW